MWRSTFPALWAARNRRGPRRRKAHTRSPEDAAILQARDLEDGDVAALRTSAATFYGLACLPALAGIAIIAVTGDIAFLPIAITCSAVAVLSVYFIVRPRSSLSSELLGWYANPAWTRAFDIGVVLALLIAMSRVLSHHLVMPTVLGWCVALSSFWLAMRAGRYEIRALLAEIGTTSKLALSARVYPDERTVDGVTVVTDSTVDVVTVLADSTHGVLTTLVPFAKAYQTEMKPDDDLLIVWCSDEIGAGAIDELVAKLDGQGTTVETFHSPNKGSLKAAALSHARAAWGPY